MTRYRQYVESRDFRTAQWDATDPVTWVGADTLDVRRADLQAMPQIYNVDAVAYESVMLGLFTMFRGERLDREKPNDLCVAFSRDGFHWSRTSREPFIPVSERQGDWNWSNVQSAGGCCLVVGDRLLFLRQRATGYSGHQLAGRVQHRVGHAPARRVRVADRPVAARGASIGGEGRATAHDAADQVFRATPVHQRRH